MKKILVKVLGVVLTITMALQVYGCDTKETEKGEQFNMQSVYAAAVDLGYEGTLEELIAAFKGDSAYILAVENGYIGTESDWLMSLVGARGEAGESAHRGKRQLVCGKCGYGR